MKQQNEPILEPPIFGGAMNTIEVKELCFELLQDLVVNHPDSSEDMKNKAFLLKNVFDFAVEEESEAALINHLKSC